MAWECPCGVSNRDALDACRACGTPQGMVWTPEGFASPMEARLLAKMTRHRAPSADYLGWIVRTIWTVAVGLGAWVGFSLAHTRSHKGSWAAQASLNAWTQLPWTVWSRMTTRLGPEGLIGLGIILLLLFLTVPRRVRENTFGLCGTLVAAGIVAAGVGGVVYFVGVFIYDLAPYFRFR